MHVMSCANKLNLKNYETVKNAVTNSVTISKVSRTCSVRSQLISTYTFPERVLIVIDVQ